MNKKLRNSLILVTTVAVLGWGANIFAHDGNGYGRYGSGYHHMDGYGNGQDYRGNLTDEQIARLEKEQRTFLPIPRI